ncbi:hypothetical protein LX15_003687 [Streptoalloteichus tenebrarius]|uniref:Uncharacterized protein n=1 Tax=Streptoalloteichus tenebrarius (strain ATCC 17920 / DSM 40477 / JCM 4838 / CBS 697.72 / NBRC 16177 / NCIMB 11028 / NRRL B-12390 / A12253. 1 / ISP 5477) TaxID=1933 RepID=A0ABT1HWS6_STRSD|nr:hypothetical protein [Streptoalloteichus tenebrarius]MCP2259976.1 hypothetical protein [Streptoalloteichus tenebrarius]BFF03915.1 hypothetical protein GCM10020241_55900 [Streptoalloteichus tenebrarius]
MGQETGFVGTDDHVDVVAVPDGVAVRTRENVAVLLARIVEQFVSLLEHGEAPGPRRWFGLRPPVSAEEILRGMFPDAFKDLARAAEFRRAHGTAMRVDALAAAPGVERRAHGVPEPVGGRRLARRLRTGTVPLLWTPYKTPAR